MASNWRKTKFYCNEPDPIFEGYTYGACWNGWECPYFTKEEALRVIEQYNSEEDPMWYDEEKDAFGYTTDDGTEYWEAEDYKIDGQKLILYPIGAWYWIWDEYDPKDWPIDDDEGEEDTIDE